MRPRAVSSARWPSASSTEIPSSFARTVTLPSMRSERSDPGQTLFTRMPSRPTSSARLLRSEEHTSELQSQSNLVCRLLLEKKKKKTKKIELTQTKKIQTTPVGAATESRTRQTRLNRDSG